MKWILTILLIFSAISCADDLSSEEIENVVINGRRAAIDFHENKIFFPVDYDSEFPKKMNFSFSLREEKKLLINGKPFENNGTVTIEKEDLAKGSELTIRGDDEDSKYRIAYTNLPVIQISSTGIPSGAKVRGRMFVTSFNDEETSSVHSIAIKVRGAVSKSYRKNSFRLELRSEEDFNENRDARLLSMRYDDDWLLDAAYLDKSLMRNRLALDIFNDMWRPSEKPEIRSTVRGRFVEVILNGHYNGIYVLSEKVDRKMPGLDKRDGILFKAVNHNFEEMRLKYQLEYPEGPVAITNKSWDELQEFLDFVKKAPTEEFFNGIEKRVDIENVVDYHIHQLLISALDNDDKNYFLAKDNNNLFFFLPWDLDSALGRHFDGEKVGTNYRQGNFLTNRIFAKDPYKAKIRKRWKELRTGILSKSELTKRIETYFDLLERGGAYKRNFERWNIQKDYFDDDTYVEDFEYMKKWIEKRLRVVDYLLR